MNLKVLSLLLEYGINVDVIDSSGETSLSIALRN